MRMNILLVALTIALAGCRTDPVPAEPEWTLWRCPLPDGRDSLFVEPQPHVICIRTKGPISADLAK